MMKSISLLICCLLTIGGFSLSRPSQSDSLHDQWLQERFFEATSIKEGMTRADLMNLFRIDGGLHPLGIPNRYVLKRSNLIKVDVEFEIPEDAKGKILPEELRPETASPASNLEGEPALKENYQFVPNEKLKIKSISRPYLELSYID